MFDPFPLNLRHVSAKNQHCLFLRLASLIVDRMAIYIKKYVGSKIHLFYNQKASAADLVLIFKKSRSKRQEITQYEAKLNVSW